MRNILLIALILVLMGCTTAPTNNVTVVNDTSLSPPTITPSGFVNTGNVTVSLSFDEPVVLTSFKINNSTKAISRTGDSSFALTDTLPDGSYTVALTAEDASGNRITASSEFTVDTTAPTLTVDPENNEQLSSSQVGIKLTFSEPVTISSAKLGSQAVAFSSDDKKTFSVSKDLGDGDYLLSIVASDAAGNTVSSNTSFTVNIATPDHTAPPQLTGLNATNTGDGDRIQLSWDASTVDDFKEYRLYQSSSELTSVFGLVPFHSIPSRVTTQYPVSGLTDGTKYCFAVTAVDNSNNELGDVVSACAIPTKEDKEPPSIASYSPKNTISDNTPTIMVTTNEAASCRYAVSNSSDRYYTYSNLTAMNRAGNKTTHTKTVSALANDIYTAYVICKDTAGNTMDSAYTWDFTVAYADTTAPVISSVSASTGEAYAVISWTTDEEGNSSVSGNFSGGSSSAMETSHSLNITGLSNGTTYGYNVTSCDAAGNCNTSSGHSFTTTEPDTTAPMWNPLPSNQTAEYATPFSYGISATDASTVSYAIDDTTNFAIDASTGAITNNTILALNAVYFLSITANDTSNNRNTTSIAITVNDTTPPEWDPTPVDQSIPVGDPFRYDANATDADTVTYYISDAGNFSVGEETGIVTNATALAAGSYPLTITANDTSNNKRPAAITITVS